MRITRISRQSKAMIVTAGLIVSLAACSTGAGEVDCTPTPSGSASDSVKVTGDFATLPTVTFDAGLEAEATERTVLIEGDGDTVLSGDTALVQFSILNGGTAKTIDATTYVEGDDVEFTVGELLPGLNKTIECATVGSRIVGVIPPVDAFRDTGSTDLGVGATDSMVFVVDVISIKPAATSDSTGSAVPALPKADGVDQPPVEGLPTVVLDDTGRPTVTIPDTAAPTELQLAVLKKGAGAVVADGDSVTVHYEGINWATKEVFDESWARGEASTFVTSQVIAGFTQALVGQTVGSQVIVVIPPSLAYGEVSDANTNALAGQTLVFVIDILGIG